MKGWEEIEERAKVYVRKDYIASNMIYDNIT
jgi:aminoglycoside/choline kinase family phosphotransferase